MSIKNLLGQRIKELRVKNKLTQDKLAELVNIDPKHQSCIETGRNFPSSNLLDKYCEVFNIEICEILTIDYLQNREILEKRLFELITKSSDKDFKTIYRVITSILN